MQQINSPKPITTITYDDVEIETQTKRLAAAMARYSTLESEWINKDIAIRRDMRQPGSADTVLLAGALEHRPSEKGFNTSSLASTVLTTIAGYKQQIELIPVIPSTYKMFGEAGGALEACRLGKRSSSLERVAELIDQAHALVDDLEGRMKQREASTSKKPLPKLTAVQLLEAWNQVCESYQRGFNLDECIAKVKQEMKAETDQGGVIGAETVTVTQLWFKYDSANYEPRTWKQDLKKQR